nr:hypothetical protein [Prevotella sp.]
MKYQYSWYPAWTISKVQTRIAHALGGVDALLTPLLADYLLELLGSEY